MKNKSVLPYLDESLSFEERAADLVSRMTLEEKASQIGHIAAEIERLGVSGYNYWREALHGVARQGAATSFPSPISMSNTWNRELVWECADVTSTEARGKNSRYNLSYWSPTINMARDPRWGRNEETMGEDPYLTSQLASSFVKGMQGDDKRYVKAMTTLKHFAANNNEFKRRGGSSVMDEFDLRNYYTKAFEGVIENVMPLSFMPSYNAITLYNDEKMVYNYVPSAANSHLLTDLLRRKWGFDGYVTTDCGAGEDLVNVSPYRAGAVGDENAEPAKMIAKAFLSGMDIECFLGGNCASGSYVIEAVKKGYLSEEQLECAVYHLMLQRFRVGEFDKNPKYRNITPDVIETDEHVELAKKAAEETWVLLENKGILPLSKAAKNIVIVGNYADEVILGDYSGSPEKITTPFDGLEEALKKSNPEAKLKRLSKGDEALEIFDIKSISLVKSDGEEAFVNLASAQWYSGLKVQDGAFYDVRHRSTALIKRVDLTDVVSVKAVVRCRGNAGGFVKLSLYSVDGPEVAVVKCTGSNGDFCEFTGDFISADGMSGGFSDVYFGAVSVADSFCIENYQKELEDADVIIAYAGTTTADARESLDRKNIKLPVHQPHVQLIADSYPEKTIVAMQTLGEIDTSSFSDVGAILWTAYNGQAQGAAFGNIITGSAIPSGKLTTTWYPSEDLEEMQLCATEESELSGIKGYFTSYRLQGEGAGKGRSYKYYRGDAIYPFGYGLSYTSFEYSNITASEADVDANGIITISADIKNTGKLCAKEIVELYISHPNSGVGKMPLINLCGFEKIELLPDEKKTVEFKVRINDLAVFENGKKYIPTGEYTAKVSKDSKDTGLVVKFNVTGELQNSLSVVKAIPDGISLNKSPIKANLSAVLADESYLDLLSAEVEYKSSDDEVAVVDENGTVTKGAKKGIAVITASVTYEGKTLSDSFPVVNAEEIQNVSDGVTLKDGERILGEALGLGRAFMLTELNDERKVWRVLPGGLRCELEAESFKNPNCFAVWGNKLFCGSSNGWVTVFSDCIKCTFRKQLADFDIKEMTLSGDMLLISDGSSELNVDMNKMFGDIINKREAIKIGKNGGLIIDVRPKEKYTQVAGSVNFPFDGLEERISEIDRSTPIVFICETGTKSQLAAEKARNLGFEKVYNAGCFERLM